MERPYSTVTKTTRILASSLGLLFGTATLGLSEQWRADEVRPSAISENGPIDAIDAELNFAQAMAKAASGQVDDAITQLDSSKSNSIAELYAKAVWHMEKGDMEEGARLLKEIDGSAKAPTDTKKYLATAYLQLGHIELADETIQEYLTANPEDKYGVFLSGISAAKLNEADKANELFQMAGFTVDEAQQIQLAAMQAPVDAQQRLLTVRQPSSSQLYRSAVPGRGQPARRLSLTALIGNEYDSNVPLRPFFAGLGSNFDHEDARATAAAFADFRLVDQEIYNLGLIASTYNTFQYQLSQFNIDDFMGGAYSNVLLTSNWIGAVRYEFHSTLVGDTQFSNDHRLTPSLTRLDDLGHTTTYFEYNPSDIRAPALIPAQNQTADIYRIGATRALYTFGGNGRIYGGYQYSEAFAEGTDFDRQSHMITGRIERPLSERSIWDLDVRYFFDNYQNPNSLDFYDRVRDDDRLEVRTGWQRNLTRPISLRFDYTYINNDSNTENLFGVRFYDYHRHVVGTQLIFTLR